MLSIKFLFSILEPVGLSCSDGKGPDGVIVAPWKSGHPFVWDVLTHLQPHICYRPGNIGGRSCCRFARAKMHPASQTQRHTCDKNFCCGVGGNAASVLGYAGLDLDVVKLYMC